MAQQEYAEWRRNVASKIASGVTPYDKQHGPIPEDVFQENSVQKKIEELAKTNNASLKKRLPTNEKGAVNAERLTDFIKEYITGKYEDHLIIMDNAMFHKSPEVKQAVAESNNTIQYTVPYYPRSNPIEQYFSQMKHYIKKESPISFDDIKKIVQKSIDKVKRENYNNYFLHAFRSDTLLKQTRTRRREPKVYK